MKPTIIVLLLTLTYNEGLAQDSELSSVNFLPEGLYATKADILNGQPSGSDEIEIIDLSTIELDSTDQLPKQCYFRYKSTGKRVKKMLAISFQGALYFQTGSLVLPKNRNRQDRDQTAVRIAALYEFNKVHFVTELYAYLEVPLRSGWETALAANAGPFPAQAYLKGVVWDFSNQEFNIFRNCNDYNEFMETNYPLGVQACSGKIYSLEILRESILSIK